MYNYFFITLFIVVFLYLVKSKQRESLVSNIVDETEPNELEKQNLQLNKIDNEKNSKMFNKGVYLTNNKINYDFVDSKIDTLIRQYNNIEYNYKNFAFKLGEVITGTNPNIKPTIVIGGSFPNNVKLSFYFPPPLPGIPGDIGPDGEKGPKGEKGIRGKKGNTGPFGSCPK